MEEPKDKEIADVIREEQSRGRQPIDTDERRLQRQEREFLLELIREGDLEALTTALRANGRTEEQIAEVVKLWKQLRL